MGKMSGKVGADVNEIVEQIEMAFEHPYKDIFSKDEQYISELFVIVHDGYTNNAEERILKKIENKPHQNHITFFDNELLNNMNISINYYKNENKMETLYGLRNQLEINLHIWKTMKTGLKNEEFSEGRNPLLFAIEKILNAPKDYELEFINILFGIHQTSAIIDSINSRYIHGSNVPITQKKIEIALAIKQIDICITSTKKLFTFIDKIILES